MKQISEKVFISIFIAGFLVTPLSSGCRLGYVTHTDPRGRLPTWVSNKVFEIITTLIGYPITSSS